MLHLQLLDPGGRRSSPQFNLFRELVIRAYLAVRGGWTHCCHSSRRCWRIPDTTSVCSPLCKDAPYARMHEHELVSLTEVCLCRIQDMAAWLQATIARCHRSVFALPALPAAPGAHCG